LRFDAPPRILLGAGDPVKARLRANCGDLCPESIALPARPTPEIEHDVDAQLQTPRPDLFQEFGNPSVVFREILDRRIVALQAGHPFVMREADGRDLLLELAGERRLADAEKAVDQVSRWHPGILSSGLCSITRRYVSAYPTPIIRLKSDSPFARNAGFVM
jgi:hypothetical protein